MTDFVSEQKSIPCGEERIYNTLSDLSNLEKFRDRIPADKIKSFTCDADSCTVSVDPVGEVTFNVIEREPFKTIKFITSKSPMPLTLWIQMKQVEENDTRIKLTARADLNPFLKPMLQKPLQDAVDKLADMLTKIQY